MENDAEAFRLFGQGAFGGISTTEDAERALEYALVGLGVASGDGANIDGSLNGFLQFLRITDTGLTLFSSNPADFGSWQKGGLNSNGKPISIPCP